MLLMGMPQLQQLTGIPLGTCRFSWSCSSLASAWLSSRRPEACASTRSSRRDATASSPALSLPRMDEPRVDSVGHSTV